MGTDQELRGMSWRNDPTKKPANSDRRGGLHRPADHTAPLLKDPPPLDMEFASLVAHQLPRTPLRGMRFSVLMGQVEVQRETV